MGNGKLRCSPEKNSQLTRAATEVHPFFLRFSSTWELARPLPKTDYYMEKNIPDETPMGPRYTARHLQQKNAREVYLIFFSDDFGVQELPPHHAETLFQTKVIKTSIVERVKKKKSSPA